MTLVRIERSWQEGAQPQCFLGQGFINLLRNVLDYYLHSGVDKVHWWPLRGKCSLTTSAQGCLGSPWDVTLNREHDLAWYHSWNGSWNKEDDWVGLGSCDLGKAAVSGGVKRDLNSLPRNWTWVAWMKTRNPSHHTPWLLPPVKNAFLTEAKW